MGPGPGHLGNSSRQVVAVALWLVGWLVGGPKLYTKIDTNPHNMDVYAYFMH